MSKQKQAELLEPGETWLADFATLHRVPTQEAYALWSRGMIRGRKVGQGRYVKIAIGPQGRYEAGYQLKALPDFVSCDECPHKEEESK